MGSDNRTAAPLIFAPAMQKRAPPKQATAASAPAHEKKADNKRRGLLAIKRILVKIADHVIMETKFALP